jgi:hypothetical protein
VNALEIGVGYSTPFLVKALADNQREAERERRLLARRASADRLPDALPFAAREFYQGEHRPHLVVIEVLTERLHEVTATVHRLGLANLMTGIRADFRGALSRVAEARRLFDFVFVDANPWEAFFDEYWSSVNPDGGMVILHSPLGAKSHREALSELRSGTGFARQLGAYEMTVLPEPHKTLQNGVLILRRVDSVEHESTSPLRSHPHEAD